MLHISKASALLCDKCRFYTTDMKMTEDWKHRMRSIGDELPQGTPLTTFMSQRTIDWFESQINKEHGAVNLMDTSSDPQKKIITRNITLQYDFLAARKDLNPDPNFN